MTVFIFVLPLTIAAVLSSYTVGIVSVLIIYFLFFLYTKWSRFEFKAISAIFSVGFTVVILGRNLHSFQTEFILGIIPRIVTLNLSPILYFLGFVLLVFPSLANPDLIKGAFKYWVIFEVGLGVLKIFELLVWFSSKNVLFSIVYLIGFGYYLV